MIDRRTFLQGVLCTTASLPALAALAPASGAARIHLVVDGACRDARGFAAALGLAAGPRRDATALLAELAAQDGAPCFGLARDSQVFVLTRLAAAHGYHAAYRGEHRYDGGALHHRLRGADDRLGDHLHAAGEGWSTALAAAAPRLALGINSPRMVTRALPLACPTDSDGHLVSFWLARA